MGEEEAKGPWSVPRDRGDDYGATVIAARIELAERIAGRSLPHLRGTEVGADSARGNVENFLGHARVPLGIAGPLRVDTGVGSRDVLVPFATTEGALVASHARGMKLIAESGGARARVVREGLTQHPMLAYGSVAAAQGAAEVASACLDRFAGITSTLTQHGRLTDLGARIVGRRLVLEFTFTTGDAIGINMAAMATQRCVEWFAQETGCEQWWVHGEDVEKRANALAFHRGRGRSVVAEARIPRDVLLARTRATPEAMVAAWRAYTVGFAQLGTQNWAIQSANGLAAVMIACGQDVAYLMESANGLLDLEVDRDGALLATVTLPSLLVGTVGGGSGQGTALECLRLMGCAGDGGARPFAEILGAVVLAGDLSLLASFCTHEFVEAHEKLGRNRPGDSAPQDTPQDTPRP